MLLLFYLLWSQGFITAEAAHFLIYTYLYLLSFSAPRSAISLPSDKTTDTDLWQRETASENAEWGIDSDKAGVICGC